MKRLAIVYRIAISRRVSIRDMEAVPHNKQEFPIPTLELEQVTTPEEFLKAVDFNVLNNIFDKLSQKSHDDTPASTSGHRVTPNAIKFVSTEEIGRSGLDGRCIIATGQIFLVWPTQTVDAISTYWVVRVLHALIHEATHVRGGFKVQSQLHSYYPEHKAEVSIRWGLHEIHARENEDGDIEKENIGVSLNEAVTENITHEVLQLYLQQTGENKLFTDPALRKQVGFSFYGLDRFFLELVINILSQSLQTDRDEIWRGFVHAHMNGNIEMIQLLQNLSSQLKNNSYIDEILSQGADRELDTKLINGLLFDEIKNTPQEQMLANKIKEVLNISKFRDVLKL